MRHFSRLFLLAATALATSTATSTIHVLGTVDLLLVETTPIVVDDRLFRFESVRPEYWNNTLSPNATGTSYLRVVDVATGTPTSPPFGLDHGLGCAVVDDESGTVYVFATDSKSSGGNGAVDVFWSTDGMRTWASSRVLDVMEKLKQAVFNTSVQKGKLRNGTVAWVMAFETAVAGTPGAWNTRFATAPAATGPWTIMDATHTMSIAVEHANPALRYVASDGFWYVVSARRTPAPLPANVTAPDDGPTWYFFTEIFRSKDFVSWEAGAGMGDADAAPGAAVLFPSPKRDQAVAPLAPHGEAADGTGPSRGWLVPEMHSILTKLSVFYARNQPDVNLSDLDLCEFQNRTVMFFNWGEQHYDNGLAVGVAELPLDGFLQSYF